MNAAIILAGGKGERLTSDTPKQFIEVGGKPVVCYALSVFEGCADIDAICVVVDEAYRDVIGGGHVYASPGVSRQHSIYNGLLALRRYAPKLVVIHDAARPLVTVQDIHNCVASSDGYDGATPALRVTDTIYQSTDGVTISALLNRDELFAGQTPECYDFCKYLGAHNRLTDDELYSIRGSSEIAVNAGMKIAIAKGNPDNFKITTNADLERFRQIRGTANEGMGTT